MTCKMRHFASLEEFLGAARATIMRLREHYKGATIDGLVVTFNAFLGYGRNAMTDNWAELLEPLKSVRDLEGYRLGDKELGDLRVLIEAVESIVYRP